MIRPEPTIRDGLSRSRTLVLTHAFGGGMATLSWQDERTIGELV
jgi:hypothetical protein